MPGITWASFRAPGVALAASSGIRSVAAALPAAGVAAAASGTAMPAAGVSAGPIARTGGEISASAVLAIVLILIGAVLRRTGRRTVATL